MNHAARSFQERVNRASWGHVALVCVGFTLAFAALYFGFHLDNSANGLKIANGAEKVSFWTCLYFSVLTESTLGYGDVSPVGVSRLIVCVQVMLGLVLAGIIVAKVLASSVSEAARLNRMVEGDWVDFARSSPVMGIVRLQMHRGRGLRWEGRDFSLEGRCLGSYQSDLLLIDGNAATFRYSNTNSKTEYFTDGIATLVFFDESLGRFGSYAMTAKDFSGREMFGHGFRIKDATLMEQLGTLDQHTEAVKALAQHNPFGAAQAPSHAVGDPVQGIVVPESAK